MDKVTAVTAAEFSVKFDGEALREHSMDIATLAPSLLALADGVKLASKLVGEGDGEPTLKIQASREGSFEVALILAALTDPTVQGLVTVTGMNLYQAIAGAFSGIKKLRNRKPVRKDPDLAVEGSLIYTMADGGTISIPKDSSVLVEHADFRMIADRFTKPLEEQGVETVDILQSGHKNPEVRIEKADRESFVYSPDEAPVADYERDGVISVATIQLEDGMMWRFNEGTERFTANVEDQDFIKRVRLGLEPLSANDQLHVRMREQVIARSNKPPRTVRTILRVDRIDPAPRQEALEI